MDIAAMSIAMSTNQVRADASVALMSKVKGLMEQQGQQLTEMLQSSVTTAPHPTSGHVVDLKA